MAKAENYAVAVVDHDNLDDAVAHDGLDDAAAYDGLDGAAAHDGLETDVDCLVEVENQED